MNDMYRVLFLVFYCSSAFGQYNYSVRLKTSTLADQEVKMCVFLNDNFIEQTCESAVLKNNKVEISGKLKHPSSNVRFSVIYNGKAITKTFVIDRGVNNISIELVGNKQKTLELTSTSKSSKIYEEIESIALKKAEKFRLENKVKGLFVLPTNIQIKVFHEQMKVIRAYPTDFYSLYYLTLLSNSMPGVEYAKEILNTLGALDPSLKNSVFGEKLYKKEISLIRSIKNAEIGNQVLEFNVVDVNGKEFKNSLLRGKNYIIVFSATWCLPCQEQLPKLKSIYSKYQSKGLKVIYFNQDNDVKRWKKHVQENNLDWINVSERVEAKNSKIAKSFGVEAIPTCFVVNKNGVIIYNSDQNDVAIANLSGLIAQLYN